MSEARAGWALSEARASQAVSEARAGWALSDPPRDLGRKGRRAAVTHGAVPYHILYLADQPLLLLISRAPLLERLQELLDLVNAEPALSTGGPVGLEISHVGPAANRAERDPECVGGLRS